MGYVGQRLSTEPAFEKEFDVSYSIIYFMIGSPPSVRGAEYLNRSFDETPKNTATLALVGLPGCCFGGVIVLPEFAFSTGPYPRLFAAATRTK
jgi:hypothetical protein